MELQKLIDRYQKTYDDAMREYKSKVSEKMQKYAYGKLQISRRIVDDLEALAKSETEAKAVLPINSVVGTLHKCDCKCPIPYKDNNNILACRKCHNEI